VRRLESRLEGPVLLQPVVHGDERGFFHETYRREAYATASRSWSAAPEGPSSTWSSTFGAGRPRSASGRRSS
jgi:dTDP-4-dehydrorhamnose 3,5-epimerase-like enzyme